LRDVNFEVEAGDIVGIIGRNGAGKSTLLRILSRITAPTGGRVELNGRVASLLEVGTGFHPELTGRENVYLNGAILGMTRAEIRRKFDEIVAFAEVAPFIDTPVKRYSSGMYVRLAFAVAAHLEPEILVVDEVLAVGDASFQQKCLGKMDDVARAGRTVLFVSHSMAAVERLCPRVLLLDSGFVRFLGPSPDGIQLYLREDGTSRYEWRREAPYPRGPHFRGVWLCRPDGSVCTRPTSGMKFGLGIEFSLPTSAPGLLLAVAVQDTLGNYLFSSSPIDDGQTCPTSPGRYQTRVLFPKGLLPARRFSVTSALYTLHDSYEVVESPFWFDVSEAASLSNLLPSGRVGGLQIQCDWSPMALADAGSE